MNLFDCKATLDVTRYAADYLQKPGVKIHYPALLQTVIRERAMLGWPVASSNPAFLHANLENETQLGFVDVLRRTGFEVSVVSAELGSCSRPAGRGEVPIPAKLERLEKVLREAGYEVSIKPPASGHRLTPAIASATESHKISTTPLLLACLMIDQTRKERHFVVVSHAFELAMPMMSMAEKGNKVALAFFGSMLDKRWKTAKYSCSPERQNASNNHFREGSVLGDEGYPITFIDLDKYSEKILRFNLAAAKQSLQSQHAQASG